jgi:hypothetical protein
MATDDVVLNFVLQGNGDLEAAFDRIKSGGDRAFSGLTQSVATSTTAFGLFASALTAVAAGFAVAATGAGLLVNSMAGVVDSMDDLADATGSTTEEITAMRAAFAAGGAGPGELEGAFRRLSIFIQQTWTEIKKSSREGADQMAGNTTAVITANLALQEAIKKVADEERDFADQRKQNAFSVQDAEAKLTQARIAAAKLNGQDTSQAEAQLQRQQAIQSVKKAQLDVEQARRKQAEQVENEEKQRIKNAAAAHQQELAFNQAVRKEEDDRRNNIQNVTKAVQELAAGNKDALKSVNANAENLAKGIVGAAGRSEDAVGNLSDDITDLASTAPSVGDTFAKIGEVLGKIEDPALRTATAVKLFGRTVSQDVIAVLSQPGGFEEFQKRLEGLGLLVTDLDAKLAGNFRSALFTLQNDIQLVGVKVGSALSPAFTALLKVIDEFVTQSKDSMVGFAASIGDSIQPGVESLLRVMQGLPEAGEDDWMVSFIESAGRLKNALGDLVDSIGGLGEIIRNVVKVFTGIDLGSAGAGFKALEVIFTSLAAAIQLASDALTKFQNLLGVGEGAAFESRLKGSQERFDAIGKILSGDIKEGWEAYKKATTDQAARDKQIADDERKSATEKRDAARKLTEEKEKAAKASQQTATVEKQATTQAINDEQKLAAAKRNTINADQVAADTTKKRLADQSVVDATQNLIKQEREKAQRQGKSSKPFDPTDFIDENGIRQIRPEPGVGGGVSKTLANTLQEIAAKALGIAPEDVGFGGGVTFGNKVPIQGGPFGGIIKPPTRLDSLPDSLTPPFAPDPRLMRGLLSGLAPPEGLDDGLQGPAGIPTQEFMDALNQLIEGIKQKTNELEGESSLGDDEFSGRRRTSEIPPDFEEGQPEAPPDFSGIEQSVSTLAAAFDSLSASIENLDTLGQSAQTAADAMGNAGAAATSFATAINDAIATISNTSGGELGGSEDGGAAFGAGGLIGGRLHKHGGTVIEAERGEFIHKGAATRFWGVDFMRAVNNMDFRGVAGRLPRFAEGGFVGVLPRFADGGPVVETASTIPGSGQTVKVDLRTDHGTARFQADSSAITQFERLATARRLTSTSKKKPGFVS